MIANQEAASAMRKVVDALAIGGDANAAVAGSKSETVRRFQLGVGPQKGILADMHSDFGMGLKIKLAETGLKEEAVAASAGISSKTIQRAINGGNVEDRSKYAITQALGITIEALESIGRSKRLANIWLAPSLEKQVYELTEVTGADELFSALSGKVIAYQISQPALGGDVKADCSVLRTDFETLTRIQGFLLSLMLMVPVDPAYTKIWDSIPWDKQLKEIESMGYRLFIGVAGVGMRAVAFVQSDDLAIRKTADGRRSYTLDLNDPFDLEEPMWRLDPSEDKETI